MDFYAILHHRSAVNFVIFLVVALATTLFILQRVNDAIEEIDRLTQSSVYIEGRSDLRDNKKSPSPPRGGIQN